MTTLALIPARGGSKGIPRKNLRPIAGKPLINWTIEAALATRGLDQVVVTTDDHDIAEIAEEAGAEVPFFRPAGLAMDDTPGIDPVLHALDMLPKHDTVVLLQPTSPLREASDIEGVLALAARARPPSVVSLRASVDHPAWMFTLDADGHIQPQCENGLIERRQDLPDVFSLNGAIYLAQVEWLRMQNSFIGPGTMGYTMSDGASVDIDGPLDWQLAELLLSQRAGHV